MTLLTVRRGNVYDLYLLDANGAELDIRRDVDISVVYSLTELAKEHAIAIAHVD